MSSGSTTPDATPQEPHIVFCGPIDQNGAQKIVSALSIATQRPVQRVHLLIHSTGGSVSGGIFLYNFFRTYPVPLTVYNIGAVQSIATVAFLGARERVTSGTAVFMLHRKTNSPQYAKAETLDAIADSLRMDDLRTREILEGISMSEDEKRMLPHFDVWFTAKRALEIGLATKVGNFEPILGEPVYSLF